MTHLGDISLNGDSSGGRDGWCVNGVKVVAHCKESQSDAQALKEFKRTKSSSCRWMKIVRRQRHSDSVPGKKSPKETHIHTYIHAFYVFGARGVMNRPATTRTSQTFATE